MNGVDDGGREGWKVLSFEILFFEKKKKKKKKQHI